MISHDDDDVMMTSWWRHDDWWWISMISPPQSIHIPVIYHIIYRQFSSGWRWGIISISFVCKVCVVAWIDTRHDEPTSIPVQAIRLPLCSEFESAIRLSPFRKILSYHPGRMPHAACQDNSFLFLLHGCSYIRTCCSCVWWTVLSVLVLMGRSVGMNSVYHHPWRPRCPSITPI